MKKITADIIYPISSAPIENGVLILDNDNKILQISSRENFEDAELRIFKGALCPGFVNAHCHLELSHLKNKIPKHTGLVGFIQSLMGQRIAVATEERLQAIKDAEDEMIASGIVAVGDISNEAITISQKQKQNLFYHTFIETVGLQPLQAQKKIDEAVELSKQFEIQNLRSAISFAPHAPYSTSISLIEMISRFNEKNNLPITIHNQETIAEDLFFKNKAGDFLKFYEQLGLDISYFEPSKKSSLQTYIHAMPSSSNALFVHNTFSNSEDLAVIKNQNTNSYLCACAQANLFIENKLPDYKLWQESGLKICIGTDSLASNFSLNIFEEIKTIQKYFPTISLETLLKYATLNGAEFLGIEKKYGSFEIGKKPGVVLINNETSTRLI